jgi:hypothetical protein
MQLSKPGIGHEFEETMHRIPPLNRTYIVKKSCVAEEASHM